MRCSVRRLSSRRLQPERAVSTGFEQQAARRLRAAADGGRLPAQSGGRTVRQHAHGGIRMKCKTLQVLGFIFAAAVGQCAYAQEHRPINVGIADGLPFSDGILAGNTLYIAGQEGEDESGQLVPGGIKGETKAALANVEKVLKAAGFEMKDIVSVTVYLADMRDYAAMNEVYRDVMPDPKPVRTTIQVAGLPINNSRIEITAIAVMQK